MVSGSGDGVRFWDLAAGKEIAFLDIGPARAVFHPDGKSLFTSGDSGLRRWPLTAHPSGSVGIGAARNLGLTGILGDLSLSRGGRRLAVADSSTRSVILVDPENPSRRVALPDHESLNTIALSPNGRWVATGTWRGTGVRVWDARTG
jgi:WD40 repeat protein